MALKGHGDPRWIVENREDGKNVNNWHWTETDLTNWTKKRLSEILEGIQLENNKIEAKITSCDTNGEVSVNTRKGKTIMFYELEINLKWEGELKSSDENITKGTIQIPYISEENDDNDFEVRVTVENENQRLLKDEVRSLSIPILKEKIPQFLKELREVSKSQTKLQLKEQPSSKLLDKMSVEQQQIKAQKVKSNIHSTSFTIKEKFMCSPEDLFWCLTDPQRVKVYAGSDAEISPEKGAKFKLFGGSVQGENLEIEIGKKIVQKWRFSNWPEDHYSTVTITLEGKEGKTYLTLLQTNVPEDDKEHTEQGWATNFWNRIKGIFGYGSLL
jgi:activator of HSP90 ATPase